MYRFSVCRDFASANLFFAGILIFMNEVLGFSLETTKVDGASMRYSLVTSEIFEHRLHNVSAWVF